jgi:MYXO-CTERM domain-containing protein
MKKLLLAAFCLGTALSALAQGTLNFANDPNTRATNRAGLGFPPAGQGSAYSAGLYWGAAGTAEGSLQLLPAANGGVTSTWSPTSGGVFQGGLATFPTVPGGTQISLQVRVWQNSFPDYASAVASGGTTGKGPVQRVTLGNAPGVPLPTVPADMVAPTGAGDTPLTRFLVAPVPEPSSIALGLLGLGAIALFRRRK